MIISDIVKYVGVYDADIGLFEGQYKVPEGITYNSYVIIDDKIAVMDSVDARCGKEWIENIKAALSGRSPDYLVVHHMEPDHSSSITLFASEFPEAKIVSSAKAFTMMKNFYGDDYTSRRVIVAEGSELPLGKNTLTFYTAPMVHWPEVVVSYLSGERILFSADGFGRFGRTDDENWADEARRYYIGIVGKYGAQVQALLKKASALDIKTICPLHGPVLKENLGYYIDLYDKWSGYKPEKDGVLILYASVYGNTKKAALMLADEISKHGCPVESLDLTRCDIKEAIGKAFAYPKLALASVTYNAGIFPCMRELIAELADRGYNNRTVGFIENGSWAPMAAKVMRAAFEGMKNITIAESGVKILSGISEANQNEIKILADELSK